jgi:DNA-directed RNA polymerase specialized sigma24 family protein
MAGVDDNIVVRDLIDRLAAGSREAWVELLVRLEGEMLAAVKTVLGPRAAAGSAVEEITQDFVEGLGQGRLGLLAGFDPAQGDLKAYLLLVARDLVRQYRRKRSRSRKHEITMSDPRTLERAAREDPSERLVLEEFRNRLTPRRRAFLESEYLGGPEGPAYSPAYRRQLRRRLLHDWRAFNEGG